MTTTKVYKTMIGARMAITMGRIKSFFKGSHYVAESYTLKFDKADNSYIVEHYTMTHDEEKQFYEAVAEQQAKIMEMMMPIKEPVEPIIDKQTVTAPKMNAKPKQTAKPKTETPNATNVTQKTASDKPKKKYYHNNNKKKSATKVSGAQQ